MKENRTETRISLFTMVATVVLVVWVLGSGLYFVKNNYEAELENTKLRCEELNQTIKDLEDQVWNVMNDEDYKLTISHDGKHYTYTSEKQNWFYTKKETVIK